VNGGNYGERNLKWTRRLVFFILQGGSIRVATLGSPETNSTLIANNSQESRRTLRSCLISQPSSLPSINFINFV
jgi:hypothetical protein